MRAITRFREASTFYDVVRVTLTTDDPTLALAVTVPAELPLGRLRVNELVDVACPDGIDSEAGVTAVPPVCVIVATITAPLVFVDAF